VNNCPPSCSSQSDIREINPRLPECESKWQWSAVRKTWMRCGYRKAKRVKARCFFETEDSLRLVARANRLFLLSTPLLQDCRGFVRAFLTRVQSWLRAWATAART
jgi:hypothetical protein